jgi:integrase
VFEVSGFKNPADLLRLSDEEAKKLVKRVAQAYLQQGKHSWARIVTNTMRGFYEAHDRELKFKRAERIRSPPRKKISHEHIPTKAEAFTMADVAGSLRNRAMILSLLQSGVRVGCLVRWTYGLVAGQLYPDVKVPVEIRVTPAMDTKLNLYGLPYYVTYLHEEAAHGLKDYIEDRKRRGWKPQARDPIFVTESSASRDQPMDTTGVWEVVKNSARAAGLDPTMVWTHTLRKSFRKVLNAESSRDLDDDTREALMGHKLPGSRGSYFDYHDTDEVREKYVKIDWSRNGNGNSGKLKQLEASNTTLTERLDQIEHQNKELMLYMLAGENRVPTISQEKLRQVPTETLEKALNEYLKQRGRKSRRKGGKDDQDPEIVKMAIKMGKEIPASGKRLGAKTIS